MPDEVIVGAEGTGHEDALKRLQEATDLIGAKTEALEANTEAQAAVKAELVEVHGLLSKMDAEDRNKMRYGGGEMRRIGRRGGMKAIMTTATSDERIKEMQELSDDIHIVNGILSTLKGYSYGGMKSLSLWEEYSSEMTEFEKAMDTVTSGEGLEWMPAASLSGELMKLIELKERIAPLIPSYQMPQTPHKRPLLTDYGTAYRATENINAAAMTKAKRTTLGTDDVTFDAEKIMSRIVWTKESDEQSIIVMLPEIKLALAIAHARAWDYAIFDGQITSVIDTGDDPSGNSWDVRNCWDGFRHYCSTNSSMIDIGAAWTGEGIVSIRKLLGTTGIYPSECVWTPGINGYYKLLTLKDAAGEQLVMSREKLGEAATVVTGELGKLFGTPVVPSEFIREDLNVAGIHDGITETKTILPIFHRPGWKRGIFKEIQVETDRDIENDVQIIVTRERGDLQNMMPYATQVSAAIGYNVAP